MYYVYILSCSDGSFYTGYTNDLEKRVKRHNNGQASKYTRTRLPVRIMAQFAFSNRKEAMKREAQIKKLSRKEKLKIIEHSKSAT